MEKHSENEKVAIFDGRIILVWDLNKDLCVIFDQVSLDAKTEI